MRTTYISRKKAAEDEKWVWVEVEVEVEVGAIFVTQRNIPQSFHAAKQVSSMIKIRIDFILPNMKTETPRTMLKTHPNQKEP